MNTVLAVGVESAVLAVLVAGFQLVMLAFRNPFRPAWLGRFGLDIFAALAFAVTAAVGIGFLISGLMGAGASFLSTVGMTAALIAGLTALSAWLLQTKKRLSLADSGMSPFGPVTPVHPEAPPPAAPAA
ncbi:MAG: hypothetical protein ACLFPA_00460 [Dichotomicrobium sp.]